MQGFKPAAFSVLPRLPTCRLTYPAVARFFSALHFRDAFQKDRETPTFIRTQPFP